MFRRATEAQDNGDFEGAIRLTKEAIELAKTVKSPILHQAQVLLQDLESCFITFNPSYKTPNRRGRRGDGRMPCRTPETSRRVSQQPRLETAVVAGRPGSGQTGTKRGPTSHREQTFLKAKDRFDQARQSFEKVLEVYKTHANALRDEAADLAQIAVDEQQAQIAWQANRRDSALESLKIAQRRIENAVGEGRDYAVAAVVNAMSNTLQIEIKLIGQQATALALADIDLKQRRLKEAEQAFRDLLTALLGETKEQAATGLNRTRLELDQFDSDMKRARESAEAGKAVNFCKGRPISAGRRVPICPPRSLLRCCAPPKPPCKRISQITS